MNFSFFKVMRRFGFDSTAAVTGRKSFLTLIVGTALAACCVAGPAPLSAQAPGEAAAGSGAGTIDWWAAAHAGSRGLGGGHLFGGVEAGVLPGRIGGGGAVQFGTGNEFGSLMIGAGPATRAYRGESVELLAWAGPAYYSETLDSGPSRSAVGGVLALTVRRPLGPGVISLHGSWFNGTLDDEGFAETHGVNSLRFAVGFGR